MPVMSSWCHFPIAIALPSVPGLLLWRLPPPIINMAT